MITTLSKLLTVQLSPLFTLASTFLILFSFLGPVPVFNESVSLASISTVSVPVAVQDQVRRSKVQLNPHTAQRDVPKPSEYWERVAANEMTIADCSKPSVDCIRRRVPRYAAYTRIKRQESRAAKGPSMRFGLLGSCYKSGDKEPVCTPAHLEPQYDLDLLPRTTPDFLSEPPTASPHIMLLSFLLLVIYLCLTSILYAPFMPARLSRILGELMLTRVVGWIGILAFSTGFGTTLVLRVTFGGAVDRFNNDAEKGALGLAANIGNGFTMLWIAYGLLAPPLICTLYKIHHETKSSKW